MTLVSIYSDKTKQKTEESADKKSVIKESGKTSLHTVYNTEVISLTHQSKKAHNAYVKADILEWIH